MGSDQTVTHYFPSNDQSRQERSPDIMAFAWSCLHIHLIEDLREELHTVIVIHSKKLVVLLLGNLMRDGLPVNDSRHLILPVCSRINLDIAHLHLTAMCSLAVEALALIKLTKGCTVHPVGSGILDVHDLLVDDALPVMRKV